MNMKESGCLLHLLGIGRVEIVYAQRQLDKHLDVLLADEPRRSVLFIDSSKVGADGGCASCYATFIPTMKTLPLPKKQTRHNDEGDSS